MDLKVIALFTFLAVVLVVPGVQQSVFTRKKFIASRLQELAGRGGPGGNSRVEEKNRERRQNL
ncbi:MAG: secretion system protein, partial [Desulfofundulus sp.]